ncbi:hypothetical protein Dvina_47495 [Dactylosporangium vinaceum]|uniref:Integral membrane protein n=1 Tax=Dactylosporangium vinaceum TaxID=53362 RepID=A0ABV5M602_9ACTN|nr:hypothetical protein [Dactylosporangium vinaceum]UAB95574.1 hypothetical protein Dvina_47495 [Dactylosporangium vinaceum]
MTTRDEVQPLPAWLAWPIRVLAVIFVLPFRLAWDALVWLARVSWKYVGAPFTKYVLAPFCYYVLWTPLRWIAVHLLWRPLSWIAVHILWRPLVWFAKYVLAPLWDGFVWLLKATAPFWHLLARILLTAAKAVALALALVHRWILTPIGRAVAFVWRWVVVPIGQALRWAWNHSVVLLWRYLVVVPLRFVWTYVVVPPARWLHTWVLRPIADTTRSILTTLGLREPPRPRHPLQPGRRPQPRRR